MAHEAGEVREDEELDAHAEGRRRTAFAQIRQFGDPALRLRAHEVERFDGDLRRLAERMTALMEDARGVGLAANQVGIVARLVIVRPNGDEDPRALVNPEIVDRSRDVETSEEGCLSLRGVLVPVERHVRVKVVAQELDGQRVELELGDLGARVLQHEIDHLDGVLILDRTAPESRREALGLLRPRPSLRG